MFKNFLALFIGLFLSLGTLEVVLRFYSPLNFSVYKGKFTNPRNHIFVKTVPETQKKISQTYNNIGFRGPDLTDDYKEKLSLFTVGGSTTISSALDDKDTWPHKLSVLLKKSSLFMTI